MQNVGDLCLQFASLPKQAVWRSSNVVHVLHSNAMSNLWYNGFMGAGVVESAVYSCNTFVESANCVSSVKRVVGFLRLCSVIRHIYNI